MYREIGKLTSCEHHTANVGSGLRVLAVGRHDVVQEHLAHAQQTEDVCGVAHRKVTYDPFPAKKQHTHTHTQ